MDAARYFLASLVCSETFHFDFKIVCPAGAPILPHRLCCRAFASVYYSCMPCALYRRQTRRLQNSGLSSIFIRTRGAPAPGLRCRTAPFRFPVTGFGNKATPQPFVHRLPPTMHGRHDVACGISGDMPWFPQRRRNGLSDECCMMHQPAW